MKKTINLFVFIMAVVVIFASSFILLSADELSVIDSGKTGEVDWVLTSDGILTISGKGNMGEYSSPSLTPWYNYILDIKEVVIEEDVMTVGGYAFHSCTSLTSVTLPKSITTIGYAAFYGCTSLINVTVSEGVAAFKGYAFYGCSSLTSITIPSSVTSIGNYAFKNCTALQGVYITDLAKWCGISFGSFSEWADMNYGSYFVNGLYSNPLYYAGNLYLNGKLLTEVVIPSGVRSISNFAFCNCSSMLSIVIPDSVTKIGYSALQGCSSLVSITTPYVFSYSYLIQNAGDETYSRRENFYSTFGYIFGEESYSGGIKTAQQYYYEYLYSGPGDLIIENLYGTFYCYIPESLNTITVTSGNISERAFENLSKITTVILGDEVTGIGNYAFSGCTSLKSVNVPKGITTISYGAFNFCQSLSELTIFEGVKTIDNWAFYGCYGLKNIIFPASVEEIGYSAFEWCVALNTVTIPTGLKTVGVGAFANCAALTKVNYCGTQSEWNGITIETNNQSFVNADKEFEYGKFDYTNKFEKDENGTRYYYNKENYATGFTVIEGKTYYFDSQGYLFEGESMELWSMTYYFNEDHSTKEGLVLDEEGYRYYVKGIRNYGWVDIDGNGSYDSYFFVSSQLRCEEDRMLFDGVDSRRFFKYNPENGYMELVNGFYTDEKGTQFFKNGLGQYGWITADGVSITDRPGITLSNVHYFAYGDGLNFYMIEDAKKTIGGVVREFDENHLVKAYTGWSVNKKTGNSNYYIEGVMQQGWCLTPDGWVYLSRSENLANNITYGDAFYGWKKIGGKTYYFRAGTSTPAFVIISDPERQLTYNGVRSTYYTNQVIVTGTGADYYITNPPAGF